MEIAIIRERQASGEDVHFYPLLLTPTPKFALDAVRDKNLRPRDAKPFSDYSLNERYRHMSEAADEIAEIAGKIASRKHPHKQSPQHETAGSYPTGSQIDDEELLRNWLSEQSRYVAVAVAGAGGLRLKTRAGPKHAGARAGVEDRPDRGADEDRSASRRRAVQGADAQEAATGALGRWPASNSESRRMTSL